MTRGKKPTITPAVLHAEDFGKTPARIAKPEAAMHLAAHEAEANAHALAEQLGYEGSLSVGALEDEIRFYQRRTVEASLELGARLLLLKELTPHGEFGSRLELLGIDGSMGRRFMMATLKFSKRTSTHVLTAAGTQTKLLELLVLDDGEIEALESGGTARGLTLDDVDTMSVRELRSALREEREDKKAVEQIAANRRDELDKLKAKGRKRAAPWPEEVAGLKDDLHGLGKVLDEALGKHLSLIDATEVETDKYADGETDPDALTGYKTVIHHIGEQIERICTLAAGLRSEFDTRLAGYIDLDKTRVLAD